MTPIAGSPFGEKAQSSAARTLSIFGLYSASHSSVGRISAFATAYPQCGHSALLAERSPIEFFF